MGWQKVRAQDDADFLMQVVEQFHDWYLAAVEYDPLARAGDGSKSLARFKGDTNALAILLRYCVRDKRGEWPRSNCGFTVFREWASNRYRILNLFGNAG